MVLTHRLGRLAFLGLVALVTFPVAAEGVVRLSRAEYDRLKDAADAAEEAPKPKESAESAPTLDAASYELRIEGERTLVDLVADVTVKPSGTDVPVVLTWPGSLDALSEKGPAAVIVTSEPRVAGRSTFVFPRAGRYRITARFIPPERREGDARLLDLAVLPAAAVKLVLVSSPSGAEVRLSSSPAARGEVLSAGAARAIPASSLIRLSTRTPARIPIAVEKPIVLAETVDVIHLERDRVVTRTLLQLGVSRAPIEEVLMTVPPGSKLLSVTGPDDPRLDLESAAGRARLQLGKPLTGDATFSFLTFRLIEAATERFDLAATHVEGVAANRAHVVIAASPLRQQAIQEGKGLTRADVADLPALARPFATRGARAFRASGPSPTLVVVAPLRQIVAPADLLVAEVDILTVLTDGSRVDRRRYLVETRRSHFRAPLELGEEILSVSVDGAPAKPLEDGTWLVALLPFSSLPVRTIEVTTKKKVGDVPRTGELTLSHPGLESTPTIGTWTVVLPEDRLYRYIQSAGIQKAEWQKDAPATVARFVPSASSWSDVGTAGATVTSEVVVTAESPVVDMSKSSSTSNFYGPGALQKLPNSRNYASVQPTGPAKDERDKVVVSAASGLHNTYLVDGVNADRKNVVDGSNAFQTGYVAGIRSLPVEIQGQGKRLVLSGPLAGGAHMSVTIRIKKA